MAYREIANKSGISYYTVANTLKLMEENNLIVRKTGCIMINPKLFNNKTSQREQYILLFKTIFI